MRDPEDQEIRLVEVFNLLQKQQKQIDFLLSTYQIRWEKVQQQLQTLHLLYKQNAQGDQQTAEALRTLRQALNKIMQSDRQRFDMIRRESSTVVKRVCDGEAKQRTWFNQMTKMNVIILAVMLIIFVLYLKKDLEAGDMVDALIAVLSAGGVTIVGLASSNQEKEDE